VFNFLFRVERTNGKAEFPASKENQTSGSRPLDSLGSFTCDLGFIFDPSQTKGEIARQVTIYCRKDLVCGGTDWKLDDGTDLPECLPGITSYSQLLAAL
jgi:hypothetical protein